MSASLQILNKLWDYHNSKNNTSNNVTFQLLIDKTKDTINKSMIVI